MYNFLLKIYLFKMAMNTFLLLLFVFMPILIIFQDALTEDQVMGKYEI